MGTLQLPAYVVALGSVVSVIVSATKGGIEQVLPADNKWHDLAFTFYPMILTLALVVGYTATHGGDMFWSVVWGLLAGAWAVGAYTVHARTGTPASDAPVLQGVTIRTTPPWAPTPGANASPPSSAPVGTNPDQAPAEPPTGPSVTYSSGPPTP